MSQPSATDMDERHRRFVVVGNECERRLPDRIRIEQYLLANGWTRTESNSLSHSNLVVFVACGMTEEASRAAILSLRERTAADCQIVVFGCFPAMSLLPPGAGVALVPLWDAGGLDAIVNADVPLREMPLPTRLGTAGSAQAALASWDPRVFLPLCADVYSVLVSQGCPNDCSYCAIRKAVGPLASQRPEDVVQSVRAGLRDGYRVFRMVCENLGSYGRDLGTDLGVLLDALGRIDDDFMIDLPDLYPSALVDHFGQIATLCARELIYLVHVPVQSGAQRILDLMNRRYRAAEVDERLCELQKRFPCVKRGTDLIVGFPTESDEEFEESLALVRRQQFDWVYVHAFSPRRGTPAARMRDQVPYDEALRRVRRVHSSVPHVLCELNGYSLGGLGLPRLTRDLEL